MKTSRDSSLSRPRHNSVYAPEAGWRSKYSWCHFWRHDNIHIHIHRWESWHKVAMRSLASMICIVMLSRTGVGFVSAPPKKVLQRIRFGKVRIARDLGWQG